MGKLVLVMRDTTERPEAVDVGMVLLVGADRERIEQSVSVLMDDSAFYEKMSKTVNPYGNEDACKRIVDYLWEL